MAGGLEAKRDPSLEPVRVPGDFEQEFPGADASATEVTLNLTLAGTVTINRVEELLGQYGLVLKGFNVLAVVAGAEGPLTPTAITGRTFVGKTTVTSVLDGLERRGLARRFRHPTNRRSVLVEATAAGRHVGKRSEQDDSRVRGADSRGRGPANHRVSQGPLHPGDAKGIAESCHGRV